MNFSWTWIERKAGEMKLVHIHISKFLSFWVGCSFRLKLLTIVIVFCTISNSFCGIHDELPPDYQIKKSIKEVLENHKVYKKEASCMANYFMDNRIVDRFYYKDLLDEKDRFASELEPYLPDSFSSCRSAFEKMYDKVIGLFNWICWIEETIKKLPTA